MCEISKIPQAVRTAVCSSMIEEYCTGMFQPAKETSLAPRATWALSRGELLISEVTGASMEVGLRLVN
jgi:hypothetical protein